MWVLFHSTDSFITRKHFLFFIKDSPEQHYINLLREKSILSNVYHNNTSLPTLALLPCHLPGSERGWTNSTLPFVKKSGYFPFLDNCIVLYADNC
jgi:hypothetical protein